jgi:SAM-dependent methyltransferase
MEQLMDERPFSQACANNQQPILEIIRPLFAGVDTVLEIGSGTGQHAAYFGAAMPELRWQTSDRPENHAGINAWRASARLPNVPPPLALDVSEPWPIDRTQAIFCANVIHIISWPEVEQLFAGIARHLRAPGIVCFYGPYNYDGHFTSDSNARFDQWLKARDPKSGIRDFEAVDALARKAGLALQADHAMPANNRCLVWRLAR